jgi:phosphatidylglycerophosphate synthase
MTLFQKISQVIARRLNWATGNQITISGLVAALMGILLFWLSHGAVVEWVAVIVLTYSYLTDWWDGLVSKYQQEHENGGFEMAMSEWEESDLTLKELINYRGTTNFGKKLDPFVDKIRFIGLLWAIGHDIIETSMVWGLTVMAGLLVIVRPIKRLINLGDASSNWFGKRKVNIEVIAIALLVFSTRPLFGQVNPLGEIVMIKVALSLAFFFSLLFAILSFSWHLVGKSIENDWKKRE